MVKKIYDLKLLLSLLCICFLVYYTDVAQAKYIVGVSTNSWQESVPVVVLNVESKALSSFTSLGVSLGYQYNYSNKARIVSVITYLTGSADVHKQTNIIAPRKNFNSYWVSNKLIWLWAKTFTLGPNFVINYRKLEASQAVLNYGLFIDMDYDLFKEVRLTQSLGTISDSKQIAYSISLNRIF